MSFNFTEFLHGELFCMVPILWFIGRILKSQKKVKDCLIPFILSGVSILLCGIYLFAVSDISSFQSVLMCIFMSLTQGVIAVACAVFGNQIIKQGIEAFSGTKDE